MANEQDRSSSKRRGKGPERGGGRGGDRKGPRRGEADPASSGAHRVLVELSSLEKALGKGDLAAQKEPLEGVLRALRPLRLTSIEQLEPNARGRLITTLLRVARQSPPAGPAEGGEAEAPEVAAPAQAPSEAVSEAPGAEAPSQEPQEAPAPAEGVGPEAPAVPEAPSAPPLDPRLADYQDVRHLLGSIWRAVGDERRAAIEFVASGRKEEQAQAAQTFQRTGDWREEAKARKGQGRTRDAARIMEKQSAFGEAAELFEEAKDLKGALRASLAAKDLDAARRLLSQIEPEQARAILERAGAYELLMERFIEAKDYENVARLYERARQFDQAALAWERAGKLSMARKAYEKSKDSAGAARMRDLEVAHLIERGDRLGAAVIQVAAGQRQAAVENLSRLPGTKAFRFMQKARLDKEALEFARQEIEKAQKEGRMADLARWLEMTGEATASAEAWEKADRKDKAMAMYEQAGHWQKAAELAEAIGQLDKAVQLFHRAGDRTHAERVAALPRTPQPPAPAAEDASD